MASFVVIENASGLIVNRIVLDDLAEWDVPPGHSIINDTENRMAIGGTFIDGIYTPPVVPPAELPPPEPAPEDVLLYDHENWLRAIEGAPPLTLGEFFTKATAPAPAQKRKRK